MSKLRTLCLFPQFLFRNRTPVCLLLLTILLAASPALAVQFDVEGTKVDLGGYIKLLVNYDDKTVDAGPYVGDILSAYDAPLDNASDDTKDSNLRMTARESRLFVKTKTDTGSGILKTHFEGDFYGGADNVSRTWSGNETFRIRHAYGDFASGPYELLAGQTWSNFMDLAAGVPSMDIAGDPGFCFVRQAQIKLQYNLRPGHYIAFSAENPDRGLTANGPPPTGTLFLNAGDSDEKVPDFILKYFFANKMFTLSPRVLLRQFNLHTTADNEEGGEAWAYGVALSASVKAGIARFVVSGMYGEGVGRYGGLGNVGGAGLTTDNDVETVGFQSINGGLTLSLTPKVKWSIGAGWAQNDKDDYDGSDPILTEYVTETAIGYHTMVQYQVTPAFDWAIGVTKFERENMAGTDGDITRWQMYFKYAF